MKRIIIFLAPVILLIMYAMGCSKNHDAPTFSKYDGLNTPSDMVATFNTDTDMVDVTWNMTDTDGVVDYYIGISDSSVFDDGHIVEFFTTLPGGSIQTPPYSQSYPLSKCVPGAVAEADSVVLFFTISAVYDTDVFNNFIGPRSDSDSTLVKQN